MMQLARTIEPMKANNYRRTPVTFASGGTAADASVVRESTQRMFDFLDEDTEPDEFILAFLATHPFEDGNGRVAFVLYNWIKGSLLDPMPVPDFFT